MCAAASLAELANLPKNGEEIVVAGGVVPLVALLIDGDSKAKQYAACALARLAAAGAAAAAAAKAAAKKDPKKKPEEARDIAKEIAKAGAIVPLVELLSGSFGDAAQEEAAGALFALAGEVGNRVAITEAGGIGPLVTMLGSDNSTTQKHAKGACADAAAADYALPMLLLPFTALPHPSTPPLCPIPHRRAGAPLN